MYRSDLYKELPSFVDGLELLEKNLKSDVCLKYARITGWNFALETNPLLAAGIWNEVLPQELKIGHDAFEDKGEDIDWLSQDELHELQKIMKIPDDPHDPKFRPFWQWEMPKPKQSPLRIIKMHEENAIMRKKREVREERIMKNVYMESERE